MTTFDYYDEGDSITEPDSEEEEDEEEEEMGGMLSTTSSRRSTGSPARALLANGECDHLARQRKAHLTI